MLNNYSDKLKTPNKTPRSSIRPNKQGVVAITHTPKSRRLTTSINKSRSVTPTNNRSRTPKITHQNAIETSEIFGRKSPRRSARSSAQSSISPDKLSRNIQNSNLNCNLVTSVKYRPDNNPTNGTFLRNRFNGGSNEYEAPKDTGKNKVYVALPKTFYSHQRTEEI